MKPSLKLKPRDHDTHKGDYGHLLVVGGSLGMAGAPSLTAMAALRSGVGAVTVVCPEVIQQTVASFHPTVMTIGIESDKDGIIKAQKLSQILTTARHVDGLVVGPGLGQNASLKKLVLDIYKNAPMPVLFDADGLNLLAQAKSKPQSKQPRILTPHPGELARLTGRKFDSRAAQESLAMDLANEFHAVVALKGHRTFITDGNKYEHNQTGNPGMATAGSGDVLNGIIAALVLQGYEPFIATQMGCMLHGYSGDLAAKDLGEYSLIATDLVDYLPKAFKFLV